MLRMMTIAASLSLAACGTTLSLKECQLSPDLIAQKPMPLPIEKREYSETETIGMLIENLSARVQLIKDHNALSAEYERECL